MGGSFIGDKWLTGYAESVGAKVIDTGTGGLLRTMSALNQPGFSADLLDPKVVEFYESTSEWRLEVWSKWSAWFRPLGAVLASLFARRLQQLNLPLDPMETSRGMTSEVKPVVASDGSHLGTAWQRTLRATGQTAFGGYYGVVILPPPSTPPSGRIPAPQRQHRRVSPLRERRRESAAGVGRNLMGEEGAYLVVRGADDVLWSRRVPLPERFEVFVDDEDALRADHYLAFLKWPVIHLHYRMEREAHRNE